MIEKSSKEQVEELNAALAAGNDTMIYGGVFKIHDVDYIEIELLELPIINLSTRYLYRFCKPLPMVLVTEHLRISHQMTCTDNKSLDEKLKEEILAIWKKMVKESSGNDIKDPKTLALIEKWENISEVRIHKLKLVRDE